MGDVQHKSKIPWTQKLALALFSTVFTLGLVALAGQFIRIEDQTLNRKVIMKLWFLKNDWIGPAKIGIYQTDPLYGWRNKPHSSGRQFEPYGFDVRYHIDEKGNRVTQGSYDRPKILMLGCSFTFGHGVEDNEAYPMRVSQRFPDYKVVNAATNGWGTIQAWLRLQEELKENDDIRLVVYGYIGHHKHRNYLRKTWLDMLSRYDRENVYVDVEDGRIVHRGFSDPDRDGIQEEEILVPKETEITRQLIAEMKSLCDAKGIPFLILYLPDGYENDFAGDIQELMSGDYFDDLRPAIDYELINNKVDGHPSPEGHRQISEALIPILTRILERDTTGT